MTYEDVALGTLEGCEAERVRMKGGCDEKDFSRGSDRGKSLYR
jgi:hypothetical protein